MSLRRKTLLIIGVSVATLVLAMVAAAWLLVLPQFDKIEEGVLRADVRRASRLLENELEILKLWAIEYAQWDDAYREIAAGRFDFEALDLDVPTQQAYRAHFIAALDESAGVVAIRGLDFETGDELSIPQGVLSVLQRSASHVLESSSPATGLLATSEGLMLVAAEPVIGTPALPQVGVLVVARFLEGWQTARLARDAELKLSFLDYDASEAVPLRRRHTSAESGSVVVTTVDAREHRGSLVLRDLEGVPALILVVTSDRSLHHAGVAQFPYFVGALLIVGLGVGAAAWRISESYILRPLARLGARIQALDGRDGSDTRITGPLGQELMDAVNPILDELGSSRLRLKESEDKLRDIVNHSSNLFYAHDPDLNFTYLSRQARSFFDCEPDEITSLDELCTSAEANRAGLALKRKAIDEGERPPAYELELAGRGGRRIWVEVSEAPVVEAGRTVAMVGALADVTERRKGADERTKLETQLRHSQKMDATGRLAGGVAHDLNNLIMVINGFGGMLRGKLSHDETAGSYLAEIEKASKRAEQLTHQLLAFSRKQRLTLRPVDMNAVVNEMVSMLRRVIGEHILLSTELGSNLDRVLADRGQLEQVIVNLAINARDAMPDGGTLRIETANAAGPGRAYVALNVSDSGTGMDDETQSKIFEPFFTTKQEGKGTGLGLATVYGIIRQSGGSIEVKSQPGIGTRFEVLLPRTAAIAEMASVSAVRPAVAGGSETVLLVEDEDMVRSLLRSALESAGYEVIDMGDPTEALAIGQREIQRIDFLVTDVVMPRMNGKELATQLTSLKPELPVLYMSGYTGDALGVQGTLDEDVEFLRKPFDPEALVDRVRKLLDARVP